LSRLMQEENGLHVLIAEINGEAVGIMTYYFYKIATFSGKHVLYIEDIFIDEEHRGNGIGSRFFTEAKSIAEETDCDRIEWKCLDWNEPAKALYNKMGGKISSGGWLTYTIDL
ncbi:MAG: GNAT family N-acetyltransferase, partial [Oscillospiraceae bacterium]